jgi:hypothetical protein
MRSDSELHDRHWVIALSTLIVLLCAAWLSQQIELVYGGPAVAGGIYPAVPLGVLALCALLRRWVGRTERVLIYSALLVGLPLTSSGLMHRFLPGLVTGFYGGFANPTGRYDRFLVSLPKWVAPGGANSKLAIGAFEGSARVPWSEWTLSICFWTSFFVILFLTCFCLAGLLRRRWLETERLGFPLLILPLQFIHLEGVSLFRTRIFWWGMAVPATLFGINGLHHYFPAVDEISTTLDFRDFLLDLPWRSMAPFTSPFRFEFSPLLTGISFLMPVEVSFSTWFFYILTRAQLLASHVIGMSEVKGNFVGLGSQWLDWPNTFPFFMCQARGGLILLVAFSLWSARSTFAVALSQHRKLLTGFLIGLATLWLWSFAAGISAIAGLVGISVFFLFSLAFARLRSDGGLPVTGSPVVVAYMLFLMWGSGPGVFSNGTYVGLAFLAVLAYTSIGAWPAIQLEGLKLALESGIEIQRMVRWMVFGLILGLAAGYYFYLETIYEYGIFALDQQGNGRVSARIGRFYHYLYADVGTSHGSTDWFRLTFHGVGAVATWLLLLMRQRFLRWPLHPMGFVYGTGFGWFVWGASFVGWFCKWVVARYGGARTYLKVRPFFLGLIFGEVCLKLFWISVSFVRGDMGGGFVM